jgi:hypothetical protein
VSMEQGLLPWIGVLKMAVVVDPAVLSPVVKHEDDDSTVRFKSERLCRRTEIWWCRFLTYWIDSSTMVDLSRWMHSFPQCTPPEQWLVHRCQTRCACNCSQGSYPTCFDQETKPSRASIKKRNRRLLRSRNETRA